LPSRRIRCRSEVEDDGEGFDIASAEPKDGDHGWGLLGMRERATRSAEPGHRVSPGRRDPHPGQHPGA
jgi:signal transduction histidine kinase